MITYLYVITGLCIIQMILCSIRIILSFIECRIDKKRCKVESDWEYDINQEFSPVLTRK